MIDRCQLVISWGQDDIYQECDFIQLLIFQSLENKTVWEQEQQQEMLDKLRAALHEKDRTIEALVGSAREKDRLFRQLKSSSPIIQVGASFI